ncbi:flagellar basal body rod protein FlgF [Thermaurantiacus sp.]
MDRLIYTALSAMQRAQEAQGVTAHNLANAHTPGFRREMLSMQQGYLVVRAAATPLLTRVQAGAEAPHDLLRSGRIETTGRPLDLALEGGAWLAVSDAAGAEAYTRRGDLRLGPDGSLMTGQGQPVRGAEGPIVIAGGFDAIRIASDGRIETRAAFDAPFVEVARLKLVSPPPAALARGPDGLFRAAAPLEADPLARVTIGALETSNVEVAEALVELIEQARGFEMQTKLLAAARELDERTAALMRVEG